MNHLKADWLLDYLQVMSVIGRLPEGVVKFVLFVFKNHLIDDLLNEIYARLLTAANAGVQLVWLAEFCKVCFVLKHTITRFVDPNAARSAPDHIFASLLVLPDEFKTAAAVHLFVTLLITSVAQLEVSRPLLSFSTLGC